VIKAAVVKMDAIMASYPFTDAKIKTRGDEFRRERIASKSRPRAAIGHNVGMWSA